MPKAFKTSTTGDVNAGPLTRRQLLTGARDRRPVRQTQPAADDWIRVSRSAMACRFEIVAPSGNDPENNQGFEAAQSCLDEIDRLESVLSIFRPTSEVSAVNRAAAKLPVAVGPELFGLLQQCQSLHRKTDGAFDVTTAALSQCWGFSNRKPTIPTPDALEQARCSAGFQHVVLGDDQTVAFGVSGASINFGGIGKGFALDQGAAKLRAHNIDNALLSAGHSSILAVGDGPWGTGWLVSLRHPLFKNRTLGSVRLHSCALGTSGQEEQWFEADGQRFGHILDPRSGLPAKGVLSVTVIVDSATCADALATAFLVGGPELAERYCAAQPGTAAVILLERDPSLPLVIGSHDRAELEVLRG